MEPLDKARRDDADDALVPALPRDDVGASRPQLVGPLLDLLRGLAEDSALDRLPLAVQLLELVCETTRFVRVVRQQQLERRAGMTQSSGSVDARAEAEAACAGIDRRRVDSRSSHQRLQAGLLGARERAQAGE